MSWPTFLNSSTFSSNMVFMGQRSVGKDKIIRLGTVYIGRAVVAETAWLRIGYLPIRIGLANQNSPRPIGIGLSNLLSDGLEIGRGQVHS
jgi:hypothetical protein